MLRATLILTLFACGVYAEEIMSPEEFKAYANNKTLYFSQQGKPYGAEQYLPGQTSVWQYADGTCTRGVWYAQKDLICFLYEGEEEEQCWHFLKVEDGFSARALGREPEADLSVIWRDERPIACKGPDVGV